ncbi:MAG: PAS domain-containing protein [Myxococcales bacterium]|nr:PAS domain-containing protein [Myxococcales bacterium]
MSSGDDREGTAQVPPPPPPASMKARFEQLLDAVVDNLALIAPDYTILMANETTARYFNAKKEDLVGQKCFTRFQQRTTPCEDCPVAATVRTGKPCVLEKRSDVTDTYLELHTTPVLDEAGRLVGVLEHAKDTTARRRAAAAAAEREHLLAQREEAIQSRDNFLSVASHELRTPITTLHLQLELLMRQVRAGDGADGLKGRLEAVRRQTRRLTRLVDQLLDVSRLAANRLQVELEELDLVEVVSEQLAGHSDTCLRAGCEVRFPAPGPVVGRWDRTRLEQIIANLLSNATKYGAGRPVEIAVEAAASLARLTVRDHGIGIAPEDQQRIFERFERAVPTRSHLGLGLGLWIVRKAAEVLGGEVRVSSRVGEGATFTVELPLGGPKPAQE